MICKLLTNIYIENIDSFDREIQLNDLIPVDVFVNKIFEIFDSVEEVIEYEGNKYYLKNNVCEYEIENANSHNLIKSCFLSFKYEYLKYVIYTDNCDYLISKINEKYQYKLYRIGTISNSYILAVSDKNNPWF
jgi:hypothetical protein